MFCSRTKSNTGCCRAALSQNCLRSCFGSATPLISTTMRSNMSPRFTATLSSFITLVRSSSDAEQQAQPFCSSTTSESSISARSLRPPPPASTEERRTCSLTSFESMFTAARSLTTTPTLIPPLLAKICCNRVVFPAPRKPESTETGTNFDSFSVSESDDTDGEVTIFDAQMFLEVVGTSERGRHENKRHFAMDDKPRALR
mmetsp:Transcript_12740/g.27244  ORF Transcript_12740/g.27244 Transcript_12740/m.27244 type:complete len:201 (+) Transcript_12740:407-1009(+)